MLMKRKKSALDGRSEDRMEGRSSACLADESTISLPGILCDWGPNEGDWNRVCGESSEERVDRDDQRIGRGQLSDG